MHIKTKISKQVLFYNDIQSTVLLALAFEMQPDFSAAENVLTSLLL